VRTPIAKLLSFRLAVRHVVFDARRLVTTVVAVAAGVALVVAVHGMNEAVLASFLATVDGLAGRAALTITSGEDLAFPEISVGRVASVPGVRLAVPLVRSVAFLDDGSGDALTVMGVDLTNESAVRVYHDVDRPEDVVDDLLAFLSQPDSIIVGGRWAQEHGLGVGSPAELVTPSGLRRFVIRGLVEPQGLGAALGGRVVVMDLYAAERAFTADGLVNQVDVLLDDAADVAQTKAAIQETLPPGLVVSEPAVRRDVVRTTMAGFQTMLLVFAMLAVFAGLVICYSRLRSVFDARTWEIGLLRAVGLSRTVVFVELLKESLLLGGLGVLVGLPAGMVIARFALPAFARGTAINFRMPPVTATLAWQPVSVQLGIAVGVVAAMIAAALPAYRIANTRPVAALRLRGLGAPPRGGVGRVAIAAACLGGAIAAGFVQRATDVAQLGFVTTGLLVAGGLVAAGPLVRTGAHLVSRLHAVLFGPVGRLAAAEVAYRVDRETLAVATLGLGLGAVLFFAILGWSFEQSLVAQLGARFQAQLVVNSAFVSQGWMAAPLSEDVVAELAARPDVAQVVAQHLRDVQYDGSRVSLFSYDPSCFRDPRVCRWPLLAGAESGALERVADGTAVLVSSSLLRERGLRVGDDITLDAPTGPQRLRVAGVAQQEPAKAVIMSRARYRVAWSDHMVTWIHVVVADPSKAATVRASLAAQLGSRYRLQVRSMAEFLAYLAGQVRQAFSLLYVMEGITFLLVMFGITDAVASGVLERTRQFGMMRAIGLTRLRVMELVLVEGATLGLLGAALALGIGLLLSGFWVLVQFPALLGWNLDLVVPGAFVVAGAVLSIVLALVGALAPAFRAGWLPAMAALREE